MRTTIREVAAAAAVSVGTVSNFINHPERLAEETRVRIQQAIDALGFVPSEAARQLKTGSTPIIGFIPFELASGFGPSLAQALTRQVTRQGMHLLIANDDEQTEREYSYIRLFETLRVRALIVAPVGDIEDELVELKRRGTPSVLLGAQATHPFLASANDNGVMGGRTAVRHLIQGGCRKLAFVGTPPQLPQIADRYRGARLEVEDSPGTTLEVVRTTERTIAAGAAVADELAARSADQRPDGVFCANDLLAIGLIQRLTSSTALRIPADIAVVGYDDIEFAQATSVPLTTLRTPEDVLACNVVNLAFREMRSMLLVDPPDLPPHPSQHLLLDPVLVVRESTRNQSA